MASSRTLPAALTALNTFNDGFSPFRMPLLMTLSGMLLHKSLSKPTGTYIAGKLAGIGWPYLLWSCVILGLLTATSALTGNSVGIDMWLRVLYNPPSHLWYLAYLLVFYLLCLVLNVRVRTVLMVASLAVSPFATFEVKRLLFLFALFLLGDFIQRHEAGWGRIAGSRISVALAGVVAAGTFAASAAGYEIRYELASVPGVICAMTALVPMLSALAGTVFSRFAEYAGKHSIVFYVTHWSVLLVTLNGLYTLAGIRNEWVLFAAVLIAGIGSGVAMCWLRDRSQIVAALYSWPRRPARDKSSKVA